MDMGRERVPDCTTLLKFRRPLEKHQLGEALFDKVGEILQEQSLKPGTGTGTGSIADATIIEAPRATKNTDRQRGLEMQQTRKIMQWYFGMKQHKGVDSRIGLATVP